MGGLGSMHGSDQKGIQNCSLKTGRVHLEDLGVDGSIILQWILKNRVASCGLDSFSSG